MTNVGIGDRAPEFTLLSQSGQVVNLKDVIGKGEIVLYFYPKDNTRGCTPASRTAQSSSS